MSANLYFMRLFWDGRKGYAKAPDVLVSRTKAPDLGDGPVWECDYIPEIDLAEVRRRPCDERRDMTVVERNNADLLIHLETKDTP